MWKDDFYKSYVTSGQAQQSGILISENQQDYYAISVIKKYLKNLKTTDNIIDLGCGSGSFLLELKKKGFLNIKGIETSAEQIALSKRLGVSDLIINGNIFSELNNLEKGTIMCFILKDIIEHLKRDEIFSLFQNIFIKLSPGGKVIIHVPNAEGIFGMSIRYGDYTHEVAFTKASINQLLQLIGFTKVTVKEDVPIVHNFFSFIRFCLWKILTIPYRILSLIEIGSWDIKLSRNITVIAIKTHD